MAGVHTSIFWTLATKLPSRCTPGQAQPRGTGYRLTGRCPASNIVSPLKTGASWTHSISWPSSPKITIGVDVSHVSRKASWLYISTPYHHPPQTLLLRRRCHIVPPHSKGGNFKPSQCWRERSRGPTQWLLATQAEHLYTLPQEPCSMIRTRLRPLAVIKQNIQSSPGLFVSARRPRYLPRPYTRLPRP
jgi:hypothetical protein